MADAQIVDAGGRPFRQQHRIQQEEDFKRECSERLRQVRDEVQAFLERNDTNRQLRLVIAYEFCMAWVENGLGQSQQRHFDTEAILDRIFEGQFVGSLKES